MRRSLLAAVLMFGGSAFVSPAHAGERVLLDRVVAIVNDDIILSSELERHTDRHPLLQEALSALPANANEQVVSQKRREVEAQVLDEIIYITLLKAEADKFELNISDQDVDLALKDVARNYSLTVEELREQVEAGSDYGSWAEYREEIREQILQFSAPRYLTSWSVTEAQIREHYRKMTKDESAKVKVAQFSFSADTQEAEDRDQAFARAQAIGRRLRDGETTEAVRADLADGTVRDRSVGRGDIAPGLEDALFAAKDGAVVGPIASGQGYVVFKVLEHVASAALSYEDAKDRIRQQLEGEAFFKAEQDLRRQLRAKAHVDIRL